MIHNMTEEELLRLIGEVEEHGLIRAPGHLKEDVFCRIDRQKERERDKALFSYRVKVLAGMAAALTVLLLTPLEQETAAERPRTAFEIRLPWQEEMTAEEEWEQTALLQEREIDRAWEHYKRQQERKDAGERYLREIKAYFTNKSEWEES
ncbi:MAG: hypothetical protein NC302_01600 [Bacteroidales bacterium]|nr:hypothetical protein [Bacteroidales bacterium]MCM1414669.1 hypothetical protein [bacterium]MCM1424883.1 hypothetical protein [bacterium]